ncbi:hypothetical protein E3N88_23682 [Mikania micrantha]|uniref:Uncharacterized protein n=1 Tax=Mikania micrantha TaxID=192012 RepID=A0A5N6NDY6_9ASTR|nr:hypothetical protein E3N88_23682 [Mikania micrantha]
MVTLMTWGESSLYYQFGDTLLPLYYQIFSYVIIGDTPRTSLSLDFDSSEASLATSQSVPNVPATLSPHALIASPGHS